MRSLESGDSACHVTIEYDPVEAQSSQDASHEIEVWQSALHTGDRLAPTLCLQGST